MISATVALPGGVQIPQLGFGVFQVAPDEAETVVSAALEAGYRHVDTAAAYNNESGVGAAVAASGLPRDEVFVTSKLRNGDQGYASTVRAYDRSCENLGLEALDLYLIHWPNPSAGLWQDSWRAMEDLLDAGRVRAIGVSNFLPEHLDELRGFARRLPALDQVEVHPGFQQRDVTTRCHELGLAVEAYSPLGQGAALDDPVVAAVADRLGCTPAQVILRWHVQHGRVVIPKTTSARRMKENGDLEDLLLDEDQMQAVDDLEAGARVGGDPRTFAISQIR